MLSSNDFNRISPTAFLVAYARKFADIPYTTEIATLTRAEAVVHQVLGEQQNNPLIRGLGFLVESRYKAIEAIRAQFPSTQILELASGLLPRGMILSENPAITFIESDLPDMIQQKQHLAKQLIGDRPNLHFLTINATEDLDLQSLNQYLQPNQPVTVLCEGLLMYLTFSEKQQVCANVRKILQTYGGIWITPDLVTKAATEQAGRSADKFQPVNQTFLGLTGRDFAENEFKDLEHVEQFVQDQGFRMEVFSMLRVFDQLKSIDNLGVDSNYGKKVLAALPIFTLTLA